MTEGRTLGREIAGQARRSLLAWVVVLIVLSMGLRIPLAITKSFDETELQQAHSSYLISSGLVPHRDFFEYHAPGLQYAMSPLVMAAGPSETMLLAARAAMLVVTFVVLWLTYALGRELYGGLTGAVASLFVAYTQMFTEKALEIRPDVPATACWLACLWSLARAERTGRWRAVLWSGLWLGGGVMFTQKLLFGAAGAFGAVAWLLVSARGRLAWQDRGRIALAFVAGFSIPAFAATLWFVAQGAAGPFLFHTFTLIVRWPREQAALHYVYVLLNQSPYLVALGLMGAFALVAGFRQESAARGDAVLALALLSLAVGLVVIPVPYRQYYMLLIPLWAILAATVLVRAVDLPPIAEMAGRFGGRGGARYRLVGAGTLLASGFSVVGAIALTQRLDGPTALAQAIWWPVLVMTGLGSWLDRGRRIAVFAAVLGMTSWLGPLGPLRVSAAIVTVALVLLAGVIRGRALALGVALAGIVTYPLLVLTREPRLRNDVQRQEIQYVLETSGPGDRVLSGTTMTTLFRRGASYYFFLHSSVLAVIPRQAVAAEVLRALEQEKPLLVENDAGVGAVSSAVNDHILEHYEPTGVGSLFRRKDSPP